MILIVDDDNAVRMALSLALERAGFEPLAVGNEAEALDAVRSGRVELVILDMNLSRCSARYAFFSPTCRL